MSGHLAPQRFDTGAAVIENRPEEGGIVALDVEAINPIRVGAFPPNLLYVFVRWEVTCGFCRTRFRRWVLELFLGSRLSWVGCPACGTHNLLPHHPSIRARGG